MSFTVSFRNALPLVFLLSAQAWADPDFLIVQGVIVQPDDPIAATTVAIINESGQPGGGMSLCSGSIVASDLVVTAGHCVGPEASGLRLAFTTDIRKSPAGSLVPVTGYARPQGFGQGTGDTDMDDIALVRFEGGLPAGYRVTPLLQDPELLKDGETVTLAGFGVTDGNPQTDPETAGAGVLRKVDVSIAEAVHGKTEVVMDQTQGRGACHGDSGGPAFLKVGEQSLLFGVTSRGTSVGADECGGASIYTSLLAHARFLKLAAAGLRKGHPAP